MPQNPHIVAAKVISGDVYVYDTELQLKNNNNEKEPRCNPEVVCKGHKKEGYGLSWSPCDKGKLISCSEDTSICYWDVDSALSSGSTVLPALHIFRDSRSEYNHTSYVEDVAFHPTHVDAFASCGDDHKLLIWDARQDKVAVGKYYYNYIKFKCT